MFLENKFSLLCNSHDQVILICLSKNFRKLLLLHYQVLNFFSIVKAVFLYNTRYFMGKDISVILQLTNDYFFLWFTVECRVLHQKFITFQYYSQLFTCFSHHEPLLMTQMYFLRIKIINNLLNRCIQLIKNHSITYKQALKT